MLITLILVLIIIAQLSIGLLILLESIRTSRQDLRIFSAVSFLTLIWTLLNTALLFVDTKLTSDNISYFDLTNKLAYTSGAAALLSIYFFNLFYPQRRRIRTIPSMSVIITGLVLTILAPLKIISGYFTLVNNKPGYVPGALSLLVGLFAAVVLIEVAYENIKILRKSKDSKLKKQSVTLVAGLILTIIHGVFFLLVLPAIIGPSNTLYAFGYMAPAYLIIMTLFGLLKQGLFDIRLIVARSVGYIMSLLTVGLISLLTLSLLSNLLDDYHIPQAFQRTLFVTVTLLLAISYQPFKLTFDKLTRRLFYRDAYDTQDLLNEFNQVIVSTIDLSQLLARASVTIEKYLKPEAVGFAIRDGEENRLRIITSEEKQLSLEGVERIRSLVHDSPEKLIVTDMLEESQAELKKMLQDVNIGMMARITTNPNVEGNGYVILGYKKSGNMYNSQDTSAMEIVANELAIAMQNALQFEEIQKFNVTLQDKIDDATRKLKRTNDKLKQMDETKDEFISMASHQLRTPLTSVKGYLSMVLEGDAGDINEMQHKLLDQAFISSQRMVYLIADLLNVSRLRTGKFVIEPVMCNLAEAVEGEYHQLVDTAKARGLTLTYKKPENFPSIPIDETKIRQVMMNFMDNAIYYSTDGGHITVDLKDNGDSIEYTVTDDGIGVPKSEQHHLFTKFYRANNAKKARPDGTGLGLFMAKKVVVAQGGSIIFKSDPGKGSVFGFSFQKSKLQALADSINAANEASQSHPAPVKAPTPDVPATEATK